MTLSNQLFSEILLKQQVFSSIKGPEKEKKYIPEQQLAIIKEGTGKSFHLPLSFSGNGHGPFVQLDDLSVKYNFIATELKLLLGHSHPLYIKSHIEAAHMDSINISESFTFKVISKVIEDLISTLDIKNFKKITFYNKKESAITSAISQILKNRNEKNRTKILTFSNRYHFLSSLNDAEILSINSQDDINSILEFIKKNKKHSSSIVINPFDLKNLSLESIDALLAFCHKHKIHIFIDESNTLGKYSQFFWTKLLKEKNLIHFLFIGSPLPFGCLIQNDYLFSKESNEKEDFFSISQFLFLEKIHTFLTQGNFFGNDGRILYFEKTIRMKIKSLQEEFSSNIISDIETYGLYSSFKYKDGGEKETINLVQKLFNAGIIVGIKKEKNVFYIFFNLPLTFLESDLNNAFHIIKQIIISQLN